MGNELKLTSVKVLENLHMKFKQETLDNNFTLQKLVNRSLSLYIESNEFKNIVNDYLHLKEQHKNL